MLSVVVSQYCMLNFLHWNFHWERRVESDFDTDRGNQSIWHVFFGLFYVIATLL